MTKEEIKQHIERLNQLYSDSIVPNRDHERGRNAKIRKEALKKLESNIWLFKSYVRRSEGLYDFLTFEDGGDFHKAIIWNEFTSIQYFLRDLAEGIEKLEKRLKELEQG